MTIVNQVLPILCVAFAAIGNVADGDVDDDHDFAENPVQRLEIQSPSQQFVFISIPSRRDGKGKSQCRVEKGSQIVWERQLDYTLHEAIVDDSGCVAGYGYSHGAENNREPGTLQLILLDDAGQVAKIDELQRSATKYIHGLPHPMVEEIVHDPEHRRVLFRVDTIENFAEMDEKWMTYSLKTGQQLASVDVQSSNWIVALRSVPETQFFIAQHWNSSNSIGAIYKLYDQEGKVHWTLDKSADFTPSGKEIADDQLRRFQTKTMISFSGNPKQFELQFVRESARVTFEVSDKGGVRETGRTKSLLPPISNDVPELDFTRFMPLKETGKVVLKVKTANHSEPIRDIAAYDLDSKDQIGFIRREIEGPDTFVLVSPEGAVLSEIKLRVDELPEATWQSVSAANDGSFVIAQSQIGIGAKSRAWRVYPTEGTVNPLNAFTSPSIECISSFPDGSFVVLTNDHLKYTITSAIACYDALGRLRWRKEGDSSDAVDSFLSLQSVSVSSHGDVMVLDNVMNSVFIYDSMGKFKAVHKIEELWPHTPSYLNHIKKAADGGYWIYDFDGNPSLVLAGASGKILKTTTCKRDADMDDIVPWDGPRVDSKGELWLTDGESFFRVKGDGVASLRFPHASPESLGSIAWIKARGNRIYAKSKTTGFVHVFDLNGNLVHVLENRKMASENYGLSPIQVLPNADVMVKYEDKFTRSRWLVFSSNGEYLEQKQFNACEVCPSTGGRFIEVDFDLLRLVDNNGNLLKQIERQENGDWLGSRLNIAVCEEGSLAVAVRNSGGKGISKLCIYTADGEPKKTIDIGSLDVDDIDFDGEKVAVSVDGDTYVWSVTGKPLFHIAWPRETVISRWISPKFVVENNQLMLIDSNKGINEIRLFELPQP